MEKCLVTNKSWHFFYDFPHLDAMKFRLNLQVFHLTFEIWMTKMEQ